MAKAVKRAALKYVTGLFDAFGAVWPAFKPGKTWWKYWFCWAALWAWTLKAGNKAIRASHLLCILLSSKATMMGISGDYSRP